MGGEEGVRADSMRERMEVRFEERCWARAGSRRISAGLGSVVSVMALLGGWYCWFSLFQS